jgi:hypothetical protein
LKAGHSCIMFFWILRQPPEPLSILLTDFCNIKSGLDLHLSERNMK